MSITIDYLVEAVLQLINSFRNMMFYQYSNVQGQTVEISASLFQIIIYSIVFYILLMLFKKEVEK